MLQGGLNCGRRAGGWLGIWARTAGDMEGWLITHLPACYRRASSKQVSPSTDLIAEGLYSISCNNL